MNEPPVANVVSFLANQEVRKTVPSTESTQEKNPTSSLPEVLPEASASLSRSKKTLRPRPIKRDRSIEGSPHQESSSHEAFPPRSVVPKGLPVTETGGKAQEALSQGKRRRAEETREKQKEEGTQAEPRDGKGLGKMQTLPDQRGSSTWKLC